MKVIRYLKHVYCELDFDQAPLWAVLSPFALALVALAVIAAVYA